MTNEKFVLYAVQVLCVLCAVTIAKADSGLASSGNTIADCNKDHACKFHQNVNTFKIGSNGGSARVTAYADNVYEVKVTLISDSGQNIEFAKGGGGFSGLEKKLPPGDFRISPTYKWSDWDPPRNSHNLKVYVHWKQD